MISRCASESCARALATSCRSSARTAASPPGGVGAPTVASSTAAMTRMRSPPGVPIAVPQYRRSRSLYEWPGLAGSPGDAILSAVKWVYDGGAAFDEAFDRDGDARAHYRGIVGVLESFTQG